MLYGRSDEVNVNPTTTTTAQTIWFRPIESIPNAVTLQAIADTEAGNTTTYGSIDELFRDLESEDSNAQGTF